MTSRSDPAQAFRRLHDCLSRWNRLEDERIELMRTLADRVRFSPFCLSDGTLTPR